jgi:hypothetical protein
MTVTKESYAKNKVDNIASKRPKPTVTPPKDMTFEITADGKVVAKNRAHRRRTIENNIFRRKGFIEYLGAIKIKRLKKGKISYKYVNINVSNEE